MIKVIIFDLAGVCTNNEDLNYFPNLLEGKNIDLQTFCNDYDELIFLAEADKMSVRHVWEKMKEKYPSIHKEIGTLMKEHMQHKIFDPGMKILLSKLKKKYKLGYFTNFSREYFDMYIKQENLNDHFDYGIASFMVGARKTEKTGFLKLIKHFGCRPDEMIYIDDGEKYLIHPKKLGMHTVHFIGKEQLMKSLCDLGVNV